MAIVLGWRLTGSPGCRYGSGVRVSVRTAAGASLLGLLGGLGTGCNDYNLFGDEKNATPYDTAGEHDGNGEGTGARACPDLVELPGFSAIDESCDAEVETGPLSTVVEWQRSDFGSMREYAQVVVAPLVGQLTDDDGDGVITRDDHPDVVIVADDDGADNPDGFGLLVVLDGTTGETVTAVFSAFLGEVEVHPYRYATPVLVDLEADGLPEIVTVVRVGNPGGGTGEDPHDSGDLLPDTAEAGPPDDSGGGGGGGDAIGPPEDPNDWCATAAFHADGQVQWISPHYVACSGHLLAAADLDGDGYGEILVEDAVLDHAGNLLWEMASLSSAAAYEEMGSDPVAIDLDGDGAPEVLAGRAVYEGDGTLRCEVPAGDPDGFPAAADLDGDGLGEFIVVGDGEVHVYGDDCAPKAGWVLVGSGNGGPATVADFDGDGAPEIGLANAEVYSVYEADGTVLWSHPCTDASSHATGSSVFDFDADGQAEVLYADEITLWVLDGATGTVRLEDPLHTSRTLHEFPIAADVDGDGETEIVVPQGGGHYGTENGGVYVLGSAAAPWLGDRQVWNQHAWTLTSIRDDLTTPYPAPPNWPFSNTFRSGDLGASAGGALPDALGVMQACYEACLDDKIGVELRLWNGGMASMRAGVPVSVYAESAGSEVLLETFRSEEVVTPGSATPTFSFEVRAELVPEGVIVVRFDDDGSGGEVVGECHEENNSFRLEGVACP